MKIEIKKEGNGKRIRFLGKINMSQEIVLSSENVKRLSDALISEEEISFDTE